MPAAGWVAVFEEEGEEIAQSLVCFALVESAMTRQVRPMVANGTQVVLPTPCPASCASRSSAPSRTRKKRKKANEDEEDEEEQ
jgi:hypothetical protein